MEDYYGVACLTLKGPSGLKRRFYCHIHHVLFYRVGHSSGAPLEQSMVKCLAQGHIARLPATLQLLLWGLSVFSRDECCRVGGQCSLR